MFWFLTKLSSQVAGHTVKCSWGKESGDPNNLPTNAQVHSTQFDKGKHKHKDKDKHKDNGKYKHRHKESRDPDNSPPNAQVHMTQTMNTSTHRETNTNTNK